MRQKVKNKLKTVENKLESIVEKNPLRSFLIVIAVIFLLIIVGNFLRKPKNEAKTSSPVKPVQVYRVGVSPQMEMQAQIDKPGVIQIVSQGAGIVQNIYFKEGETISRGEWIISLSSSYNGQNAASLNRQIAEKQKNNVEDTYSTQKDTIAKQREVATKNFDNTEKLKDISSQSISDTQSLINLNNDIISTLDSNINSLSADPIANAALILSSKQMKSQFESANLQLNTALRNTNYQTDDTNPPTDLSRLQRDITLNTLNVQEKALDLNREITGLQLQLARINESLMYPSSPLSSATVEKVFVRVGQSVTLGTPIAILSQKDDPPLTATILVSDEIAAKISKVSPTLFKINGKEFYVLPTYISSEKTEGGLHSVIYNLPENLYAKVTDKSFVTAEVPTGYPDTSGVSPFVPLDTVYQNEENAYVFVIKNHEAFAKKIQLGEVFGSFVEVKSGLSSKETIILDRNIVAGDRVQETK